MAVVVSIGERKEGEGEERKLNFLTNLNNKK